MTSGAGAPSLISLLRRPEQMLQLSLGDWDRALRLARSANLMSRLAWQLRRHGLEDRIPPVVRPHVTAALRLMDHQLQAVQWECQHLEDALVSLAVPIVLLKGAAYVMTQHVAAQGRLFGDIDLLVPRVSLARVEAALMLHGWSTGALDPYDQRYYREWMHELPPMAHQSRGTLVDVHHNILPLTSADVPNASALLADSVQIPGSMFRALSKCDMVIHSAVHLFHEGELKNGLRDLFDLDALLTALIASDPDAWDRLLSRARELGLVWPVFLALRYCRELLGTPIPSAVADTAELASGLGRTRLKLLDAIYRRALAPDHSLTQSYGSSLARGALFVRSHALRMPLGRLTLHLGRKAFLRAYKRSSRTA